MDDNKTMNLKMVIQMFRMDNILSDHYEIIVKQGKGTDSA